MVDYRPEVQRLLRQYDCSPYGILEEGVVLWHSPKTDHIFSVEPVIRSSITANEILTLAGIVPIFNR